LVADGGDAAQASRGDGDAAQSSGGDGDAGETGSGETSGASDGSMDANCRLVPNPFGNDDCHHSCTVEMFAVDVPADRVADVASVSVSPEGPCRDGGFPITGAAPGIYYFSVTDVGVCRVTVSFSSGAPDFTASVLIVPNCGPCCLGRPIPQDPLIMVPELEPADASPGG
jgi:hypothetical protein